jgi:TP901 family phage tail tape measure protein
MTGVPQAEAGAAKVTAATREMGTAAKTASASGAAGAATLSQKWTGAGAAATATGKKLTRGLTLPILGIGAVTGKLAVDFEKAMRNVNSIAQLPEPAFQRLNKQVLAMAGPTAQAPKTLAEGLYDLVSSGFDAKESITILNASARAATAGLTTTEVSTKAVAAALNAYHRPASDAKAISDDLFQTVNLGVITFDELASTIGYVLPAANTMGVDLKQVGAAISTLTKQGQSGSNAVTNINAALTAFIKPSKGMAAALKALGVETSEQLIHQRGFEGALRAVIGTTDGTKEAIGALFPNVRAMRAVFGLTGSATKSAAADLRGFQHDTGATSKVLSQQSKSIAFQWNKLKAEGAKVGIELGQKLVPVMGDLAHEVAGLLHGFSSLPDGVQTTTIKLLAFGAVMGPVLRVGGLLIKTIGGIASAVKWLAATDLAAGIAQAVRGDTAILQVLGGDLATTLVGGLARAIPIAAATAGVVNILSSVISGDGKGALEKTGGALGGALLGGIIGSVVPGVGTAIGAAVGGGAGSFLGPMIGSLFDSEKKITPLQARLAASAKGLAAAMRHEGEAAHNLSVSNRNLADAKHRQQSATNGVKRAEQNLTAALREHHRGTMPVLRAELELARAKHQQAKATREVRDAERLQGYERKIQMPIMRTSILEARHRVNVLKDERQQLRQQAKAMVENGSTEKERIQWMHRARQNSDDLAKAEKRKNEILADAARLIGPKFAKSLERASRLQLEVGNRAQSTGKTVKQYYGDMAKAVFGFSGAWKKGAATAQGSTERLKGVLGPFRSETNRQMGKATGDVRGFVSGTKTGFLEVEAQTDRTLTALGVKQVNFNVSGQGGGRQKRATGGIVRIPGVGKRDTVPLDVMGVPVVAAPGEDIAFLTGHQRADLDFAVRHVYGDSDLERFFHRQNRPHYMARGGIVEPSLGGTAPMRPIGQHEIHAVTQAAREYIRRVGGDKTVKAVIDNGNRMDALHQPYLWGGGHGSTPSRMGPWDCSGGISELLYGAGWKELTPMVSSGFETWGEGGQGRVSILANPEHVYAVVDGRGAIGTSGENPGGGFGWINGYTFRPGFTVRHADLFGEGEVSSPRRGKGQPPAKGFARGGLVVKGRVSWFGGGATAGGKDTSQPGLALNLHPGTESGWNNATTQGWMKASRAGHPVVGDTLIKGHHAHLPIIDLGPAASTGRAIDVTEGGVRELGFSTSGFPTDATGVVTIEGASAAIGGGSEDVPAVFAGARTKPLNFPSMPKSLHGVEREIARRQSELGRYRRAMRRAHGRPKIEHALAANVKALETRLDQLRRQRALLRRKAAQKKVSRRLARKLRKITGVESQIEAAERIYNIAEQFAEQVVALEPVQPSEGGEAAERAYVEAYKKYINEQERPAYGAVLDRLADWRNVTLLGESTAGRLETGWEGEVTKIDSEVAAINAFTRKVAADREKFQREHPKDELPKWIKDEIGRDHQQRARLPVLRFRDREVRKVLGEAREAFYPGRKTPVHPPTPPAAGSGSIEDTLTNIQGVHWPDQHAPIAPLPGKRVAGWFGGAIWDAQTAIEELDLKINQATASLSGAGGGSSSEAEQQRIELLEEQVRNLQREKLIHEAQRPVLGNYLGAYKTGGRLPEDGYYLGHKDETVLPADVGPLTETHVHIRGREGVLERLIETEVETRMTATGRRVGLARATPSSPGRRAALTQRQRRSP